MELDTTRDQMAAMRTENQELWRRYRVLEQLVVQSGSQLPVFEELVPVKEEDSKCSTVALSGVAQGGHGHASGVNVDPMENPSEIDGEGEEDEEAVLAMAPQQHSMVYPLRQGMQLSASSSSSLKRRQHEDGSESEYQDEEEDDELEEDEEEGEASLPNKHASQSHQRHPVQRRQYQDEDHVEGLDVRRAL